MNSALEVIANKLIFGISNITFPIKLKAFMKVHTLTELIVYTIHSQVKAISISSGVSFNWTRQLAIFSSIIVPKSSPQRLFIGK